MSLKVVWSCPSQQQWAALFGCSEVLQQADWKVAANWGELRQQVAQGEAQFVLLGPWINSGVEHFQALDVLQALECLRLPANTQAVVLLEASQAGWLASLEEEGLTVLVETPRQPLWPRLARLLEDALLGQSGPNPLRDVNEWVLVNSEGLVLSSFQSLDAELRSDLMSFVQTKARALEACLKMSGCSKVTVQTERFVATLHPQADGGQLLAIRHQDSGYYPKRSGPVQLAELRERGVQL